MHFSISPGKQPEAAIFIDRNEFRRLQGQAASNAGFSSRSHFKNKALAFEFVND
jgi:hypothetical protein